MPVPDENRRRARGDDCIQTDSRGTTSMANPSHSHRLTFLMPPVSLVVTNPTQQLRMEGRPVLSFTSASMVDLFGV